MDLREVGYDDRDWLNLAQDRDRWRAYAITENYVDPGTVSVRTSIGSRCNNVQLGPSSSTVRLRLWKTASREYDVFWTCCNKHTNIVDQSAALELNRSLELSRVSHPRDHNKDNKDYYKDHDKNNKEHEKDELDHNKDHNMDHDKHHDKNHHKDHNYNDKDHDKNHDNDQDDHDNDNDKNRYKDKSHNKDRYKDKSHNKDRYKDKDHNKEI
ncbi:hypothetical protein ANN_15021 [Periplaneta americana]|uniref:Uncharacterized protein n=1 Tax=Periplaneta americana TaxID=6978 RepID=A0ABQ8T044_PERAM|nr:hypothetical protein ANN_15021 [Periplaneta americana]